MNSASLDIDKIIIVECMRIKMKLQLQNPKKKK